jgi:hypothetical protein
LNSVTVLGCWKQREDDVLDLVALVFYAIVCGVLSWAGPRLGTPFVRFGIGAIVGVVAASLLPSVRLVIGG